MPKLTAQDLAWLAARGLTADEASRQLDLLRSRPAPRPIVRPCTLGDGIERIEPEDHPALLNLWQRAAAEGRLSKFVPASGAATRMFADLATEDGRPTAVAQEIHSRRADFAFAAELEAAVAGGAANDVAATVHALVSNEALGLSDLPKALVPFHAYPDLHAHPGGPRTALVEQLVEAAAYVAAEGREIRVHFTVTEGHRALVEALTASVRQTLEERFGAPLTVGFSIQDPSSDTLAIGDDGSPCRHESGDLMLRPAGHGALLSNLQTLGSDTGDVVVIKNIDNIQPEYRQPDVVLWKRLLIGRLLRLEADLAGLAGRVDSGGAGAIEAAEQVAALLGIEPPASDLMSWASDRLRRPTRVCGMVENTLEPGGGPFWVRGATGSATPQIVESAQIDLEDPGQEAAWRAATHFNPVDLVCSLRDARGLPHDLSAFVDRATAFVSRKESSGRGLWALERPGLWNGAMAGWNTVFVEVPALTFAPVKNLLDLLRPEHQPAAGR